MLPIVSKWDFIALIELFRRINASKSLSINNPAFETNGLTESQASLDCHVTCKKTIFNGRWLDDTSLVNKEMKGPS